LTISKNLPKSNKEITATTVRLVDSNGSMLGIVNIKDALHKAATQGLDLVEISPHSEPPVCKILDFGKFKYEEKKKKQSAKKKQKVVELKEIKLRPNIGENDLLVKVKHIKKFLTEGNKVKVTIRFRGREITHNEIGLELAKKVLQYIEEIGKAEVEPRIEGQQILMIIVAK
jgi:translation initiation factor IF-3